LAHSRSARKRIRQNETVRRRNRGDRSELRTRIKTLRQAIADKSPEAAKLLPQTVSLIDRLVKKGVIRENTAARYKSRLTRRLAAGA
jgi:small subunit ribosomal protein S20